MKIGACLEVTRSTFTLLDSYLGPCVIYTEDPNHPQYDSILVNQAKYIDFSTHADKTAPPIPNIHPSLKILVWCK